MADIINEQCVQAFLEDFTKVENEVAKAVIGQRELVRMVLIGIVAGGNVLLEGLPGLGKTQLVKTLGKVLDMEFSRIQFTPDLMPTDITGTDIFVKTEDGGGSFEFQKGPVFTNILLADEINRATPKTQSALLEAMQERHITAGRNTYNLPQPFFVLATQNPIETEGTYPLPEAQLDRFMFKLNVGFPTREELKRIVSLTTTDGADEPQTVLNGERILEMKHLASQVPVADAVADYAMDLIIKTHPELTDGSQTAKKYVACGVGTRGAQAIITGARINALLEGRYNVAYDDIARIAPPVLRHRLILNFDAVSDGLTEDTVVAKILEDVKK
jgi:MoxR-like ATPase